MLWLLGQPEQMHWECSPVPGFGVLWDQNICTLLSSLPLAVKGALWQLTDHCHRVLLGVSRIACLSLMPQVWSVVDMGDTAVSKSSQVKWRILCSFDSGFLSPLEIRLNPKELPILVNSRVIWGGLLHAVILSCSFVNRFPILHTLHLSLVPGKQPRLFLPGGSYIERWVPPPKFLLEGLEDGHAVSLAHL